MLLYMSILHNYHGLVYIYLPMMNDVVLDKMAHHVSATLYPIRIAMFQLLGLVLFFNTHLGSEGRI